MALHIMARIAMKMLDDSMSIILSAYQNSRSIICVALSGYLARMVFLDPLEIVLPDLPNIVLVDPIE